MDSALLSTCLLARCWELCTIQHRADAREHMCVGVRTDSLTIDFSLYIR